LNLDEAVKVLAMEEGWIKKRMKAIRFNLINIKTLGEACLKTAAREQKKALVRKSCNQ